MKLVANIFLLFLTVLSQAKATLLHIENNKSIVAVEVISTESACADYLSLLKNKPVHLEFIECKKINSKGLAAFESQYRLEAVHASEIERYFVKTAHMPRLHYLCCGWESFPDKVKSKASYGLYKSGNQQYQISMGSAETLINRRANWMAIPYFYVTLILYLELP